MTFFELFLIGIGLSMDAFAVSICKGLSMQKIDKKYTLCIGLFFGGFQALMPLTGYLLGSRFSGYIERFDHWIAFVLLAMIGFNMIKESREEEEEEEKPYAGINFKELLILAVATSIDALAVGVTFAFLQVNIVPAITIIGCTTFVISIAGVYVGNVVGSRYKSRAEKQKGAFSHVREGPLFESPKRTAGAFRSRPCTPNDQKGGALPLLFGLSTPLF